MSEFTASALAKGRQFSHTLSSDIPLPKFTFGQQVENINTKYCGHIKGQIVGLQYTSRDAALAENSLPGWSYTIETPAFKYATPLHQFNEEDLCLVDT